VGLTRTYRAIIGTGANDPVTDLTIENNPIYTVDSAGNNILVAASESALWNSATQALNAPINYNEFGNVVSSVSVWAGASAVGMGQAPRCTNWTTSAGGVFAIVGLVGHTDSDWISYGVNASCGIPERLYCISQ
jgi:hypothetical protein